MNKLIFFFIAIVLIACSSNNSGNGNQQQDTTRVLPNSLADTLLTLQKQEDSAESAKDFDKLNAILSPRLLVTRVDGGVWTRDQLYEDIKSLSEENYENPIYEDVHSTRSGHTAILSYRVSFANQGASGIDTSRYRITTTWVKERTNWMMLGMCVGRVE